MKDGKLNVCIECSKLNFKRNYHKHMKNDLFAESERLRRREKYLRTKEKEKKKIKEYQEKFPEKYQVQVLSNHIKTGNHNIVKHHWSYNIEHAKDVIFLSRKKHCLIHAFLVYDQKYFFYRRSDTNELLNTREKHEQYIKSLK